MIHTTKTFAVIGGDLRNAHLAGLLAEDSSENRVYGMFMDRDVKLSGKIARSNDVRLVLPQSDVVIFPLPMLGTSGAINTPLSDGHLAVEECFSYIPPEAIVVAGKIPPEVCEMACEKGIDMVDYLEREELAVLNAVPTAEGAVEIALRELPVTLFGSTCIVTGHGRIARVLIGLLRAFGADVRVVARKHSDLAWIRIAGATAVHLSDIDRHLKDANVLFNTVPAVILGEDKLSKLGRNCLVIDLASKPGGVDFDTARKLELKTIWALSLPGKVAPITAGAVCRYTQTRYAFQ